MAICNGKNVIVVYRNGKRIRIVGALTSVTPEALAAPEISLDGDTLTMTATDSNTQEFVIFVDGVEKETVAYMEFDLSTLNLSAGTHEITVKARASGFEDSPASNAVSYVVATPDTPTGYTVSGTWRFNDVPRVAKQDIVEYCSFTTESGYYCPSIAITSKAYALYRVAMNAGGKSGYNIDVGWDSGCQVITFDGVQDVSKEFYEWFVANAVQQTITFTIDGTEYTALSGMTWGEWVASEYNTGGFFDDRGINIDGMYVNDGYSTVYDTYPIIADYSYTLTDGGAGN